MNDFFVACITVIFLLIFFFLLWLTCKLTEYFCDRTINKFKQKHPKYAQLDKEYSKMLKENCNYYNKNIADTKTTIDRLLIDIKYYNEDSKEYDDLLEQLYNARNKISESTVQYETNRNKIKEYINENIDEAIEECKGTKYYNSLIGLKERYSK